MKKLISLLAVILCVVTLVACLVACNEKGEDAGVTIKFVTGFDDVVIDDITLKQGVESYMPDDPLMVGYNFIGWFTDSEYTNEFDLTKGITTDIVLYAKWEKKNANLDGEGEKPTVQDENGFVYSENADGTLTVVSFAGSATAITISNTYDGKPIKTISATAFANNANIESIHLGKNVAILEHGVFSTNDKLTTFTVNAENGTFSSNGGVLYSKDGKTLSRVGNGFEGTFIIPSTVSRIGEYAFAGATFDVTLKQEGNKVVVISNYAFASYEGKLTLSNNVMEILKYAFYGATCEIDFVSATVKRITNGAFDGYVGEKIVFNGNVEEVSDCAFNNSTAVIDLSKAGLEKLGDRAFFGYAGEKITVPYSVKEIGSSAFYHSSATVEFEENSLYLIVRENTFNQFYGDVVLPISVNKVEKNAFYAMKSPSKVIFERAQSDITFEQGSFNLCGAEVIYQQ